jgi:hypothetical protein
MGEGPSVTGGSVEHEPSEGGSVVVVVLVDVVEDDVVVVEDVVVDDVVVDDVVVDDVVVDDVVVDDVVVDDVVVDDVVVVEDDEFSTVKLALTISELPASWISAVTECSPLERAVESSGLALRTPPPIRSNGSLRSIFVGEPDREGSSIQKATERIPAESEAMKMYTSPDTMEPSSGVGEDRSGDVDMTRDELCAAASKEIPKEPTSTSSAIVPASLRLPSALTRGLPRFVSTVAASPRAKSANQAILPYHFGPT